MKIVQAFGQEARESSRFRDAVARAFATARRRIVLRAFLTAIVITMLFGSITLLMRQAAIDVSRGRAQRRHRRRLRHHRRHRRRRVRRADRGLWRAAARRRRGRADRRADGRGAADQGAGRPGAAARAGARRARLRPRHLPLSDPARTSARSTISASRSRRARRWPWSARRAPARRPCSSSPSASTIPKAAPSGSTASTCATPIRPTIRARIAIVPQETVIFAASARDNLRYGHWEASDDELWEAAEAANAAEFLRRLPEGLDTYLGEGGARLSGGQRQRIAIARALAARCAAAAARRGDLGARRRIGAAGPGLARAAVRGAHDDRHRPPPRHRPRRRPDRRHGPWPDRRGRRPRRSPPAAASTRASPGSSSRASPPRASPSFQRKLESHFLIAGSEEQEGFQLSLE